MKVACNHSNSVEWNKIVVRSSIPEQLYVLKEMAHNIWWSWNYEALNLFREIDHEAWLDSHKNPVSLFEHIPYERMEALAADSSFMERLNAVYGQFRAYMDQPFDESKPSVAYFSMEYGLTDVLKIYSGGLGVLAGDYLKEASDCRVDMVAVGFLYRNGYFTQTLSMEGQQIAVYEPQDFDTLPIEQVLNEDGTPFELEVQFPGYRVYCSIWKANVGRVPLYLIDTDHYKNSEYDRQISAQLYGGDWENRLKQEVLLGIGGIQLLNKLGIKKQVYHCNEGHAALINAQRIADLVKNNGLPFEVALEVVRASSLYTVHTPVPAGHDMFEESLFAKYMADFAGKLGISWNEFMDLGRENPGETGSKFSMSVFACKTCQEVNGVSKLHGKVSRDMFAPIWKGYFPDELHVGYVTNGVHVASWTASEWLRLYKKTFGPSWLSDMSNPALWEQIYSLSDEIVWETHQVLKHKLIEYIKVKYKEGWLKNHGDPGKVMSILDSFDSNSLIIGFGRRFATYKRAHLLFSNLERLSAIVNNPQCPVQFVYTGKAHPADGGGQGLIKRIIEISKMPEFAGKIIFLENYDMGLARRLVSGVDIWLNTPTRPLEASGTSGQKAEMNGVLNFSVLDGWWLEGYVKGAGWAITEKSTYDNAEYQDQLDAATIYSTLENEIIPLYFAKNGKGYSPEWVMYIKHSIARIAPHFTTKRMIDDYIRLFYEKLAKRSAALSAEQFRKAYELVAWKERIAGIWDNLSFNKLNLPDLTGQTLKVGNTYSGVLKLEHTGGETGFGMEMVIYDSNPSSEQPIKAVEMDIIEVDSNSITYKLDYKVSRAGSFNYAFRIFPKHVDLAHRQDFCYLKWFN